MSFESLVPAISENQLNSGGAGVAYINMMFGLGALLLSIAILPIRSKALIGRLFLVSAVVSIAGNVALALAPTLLIAMLGTVVIGISHTSFMTMATIMIQVVAPDSMRGRITAIYLIHAGGIMAFSYFLNGVLADIFDPSWVLLVGSLAFMGVLMTSVFIPTPRRLYNAGIASTGGHGPQLGSNTRQLRGAANRGVCRAAKLRCPEPSGAPQM